MKKVLFLLLTLLMGISAQAQSFSYLRFNSGSGTEQSISTDGLKITFSNGYLVASSNDGSARIALNSMNFMYFSNTGGGSSFQLGDVNRDGSVNVSDVTTLINMILGLHVMDEEVANINGDSSVNVSDVTALINIILGLS